MIYYAHQDKDTNKYQTVDEHCENVRELSKHFSKPEFSMLAEASALLHDIGKNCQEFQERINGKNISVEHSIAGAKYIIEHYGDKISSWIEAYCIAGHHTGLPDGGVNSQIGEDDVTLLARLKRDAKFEFDESIIKDFIMSDDELLKVAMLSCDKKKGTADLIEFIAFTVRYIYSCLVDADYIDTEKFYKEDVNREISVNWDSCLNLLKGHMKKFKEDTPIKKARNELLEEVKSNIKKDSDIYLLNIPTGSGKTLCSISAALDRIENNMGTNKEKKRIIYISPYNSITEQTAKTFGDIFKDVPILQHHSNYFYEIDENDTKDDINIKKRLKLASENWDANFIISTNVQFFESFYNYKSSRLRKIHNYADSIIIFDEIHMMPKKYLYPCIKAIGFITKYLNSEVIFLTATMPNFETLFKKIIPFVNYKNLVKNRHEDIFRKCKYVYRDVLSNEKLLSELLQSESAMVVVNKRDKARDLYLNLKSIKTNENIYHLSTYMTAFDRTRVLNEVREKLKLKERVILVSTSLIEAGVDVDFAFVYREISGLDSVLQAGGRCNREGLRNDSVVNVFKFEDSSLQDEIAIKANITQSIFKKYDDITTTKCIMNYYELFYDDFDDIEKQSIFYYSLGMKLKNIPFRTYSEQFNFIDNQTINIVVNNNKDCDILVKELIKGNKKAIRALNKYSANVYFNGLKELIDVGVVDDYETGVYVLKSNDYYDKDIGLNFDIIKDYIE